MTRFGVAGYPPAFEAKASEKRRLGIFNWLRERDLDAFEAQMTYGPRTSISTCREMARAAADANVSISVHASYFVVLTSDDPAKVERSIDTLARTFELADLLGARTVVLHPGSTYGRPAREALDRFCVNAARFLSQVGRCETSIFVETAGKLGQLGSLAEILAICEALPDIHPCVDFGHVHARTIGGLSDRHAICELVRTVGDFLDARPSRRCHFHYTPIHYGPRGEIAHRAISDEQPDGRGPFLPRHEDVARALVLLEGNFTVISETRDSQEQGAVALRDVHRRAIGARPGTHPHA